MEHPSSGHRVDDPLNATYLALWAEHRPQFPPPAFDMLPSDKTWFLLFTRWLLDIRRDRGLAKTVLYLSLRQQPVESVEECSRMVRVFIHQENETDQIPWTTHQDWTTVSASAKSGDRLTAIAEVERCLQEYDAAATDMTKRIYWTRFWRDAVTYEEAMTEPPKARRRPTKSTTRVAPSTMQATERSPSAHRTQVVGEEKYLAYWAEHRPQFPPPAYEMLPSDKTWSLLFTRWLLAVRRDGGLAKAMLYLSLRQQRVESVEECVSMVRVFIQQKDETVQIPWTTHQDWSRAEASLKNSDGQKVIAEFERCLHEYDVAARKMTKPIYQTRFWQDAVTYEEALMQPPTA